MGLLISLLLSGMFATIRLSFLMMKLMIHVMVLLFRVSIPAIIAFSVLSAKLIVWMFKGMFLLCVGAVSLGAMAFRRAKRPSLEDRQPSAG